MGLFKRGDSRNWWMNYTVTGVQHAESTKTQNREQAELIYKEKLFQTGARKAIVSGDQPGVYAIRSTLSGLVKIGHSQQVCARIQHLQKFNPEPLELIALLPTRQSAQAEAFIHRHLKNRRKHSEWFEVEWHDLQEAITLFYQQAPLPRPARRELIAEEIGA